jgi:TusA-related sulfurtransferase
MKGPVIPSLRVTQAVERIETTYREDRNADESFFSWSRRKGADYFNALLHDLAEVTPLDVQFLARDHGEEDTFKVLQLGGGECAGAAQDLVASNFSEAMHERTYRNAFMLQRKYGEAAECSRQIVRLVNQSLLFLAGEKAPDNDDEQISLLKQVLKDNPVIETAAQLLNELQTQENMPDPQLFETLASRTDQWMTDAGRFCQSVDSQLDLATTLPELSESALNQAVKTIDLTEYACPLHYIKARHHLNQLADGGAARFVFRTDDSVEQVAASIASDGHVVNDVSQSDNRVTVTVQKTPSAAAAL